MHAAVDDASARSLFTTSTPVDTPPTTVSRTFESQELSDRLTSEADAERDDRAKRALLDALGRMAEWD